MDRLTRVLLSFLGLGFLPVAPGTWGTAGAAVVVLLLPEAGWPAGAGAVLLLACALTLLLGGRAERLAGRKDPGFVVTDEVAGYLVTVAAVAKPGPWALLAGFLLFRFFDVLKPWPVRAAERAPGGFGVLLDDLLAGLYGLAVMLLLHRLGAL